MNRSDKKIVPKITLTGAGPGDPNLITVKALKALKDADVVLYDALVSPEILDLIPVDTPAWSVGKRAGSHSFKQEEINKLMVDFARQYGHVVRLKGGDPFVFGRGYEEVEMAISHGIVVQIIPGISSVTAVPAAVNIPLTRRLVSESFWVLTGTTQSGRISEDIALAAQSTATVVILMGMNKLDEIMSYFVKYGRKDTPVAVIQNGTMPDQQYVIGTVETILQEVKKVRVGSPGLIVVGEVVKYATKSELQQTLNDQGISIAAQ